MLDQIKVSVIVPIYNAELYLIKCINSICSQTHRNLEIILVDDGSTDNSGSICDFLATADERIKVVHTENRGQASARNKGLDLATGEYIGFVDSDDYIENNMYEIMLENALKENADIVQIGHYVVSENSEIINIENRDRTVYIDYKESIKANIFEKKIVSSICDKLFHYSLWDNLRMQEGYYYEDGMVLLNLMKESKKMLLLDKVGYYYVLSNSSTQRGPFNITHLNSCLYEPKYFFEFFKKYCEEYINYSIALYCYRSMRGFRFLQSVIGITSEEKKNYKNRFLRTFNENYRVLKKTSYYSRLSLNQKVALFIFSILPSIYLKIFSTIKK